MWSHGGEIFAVVEYNKRRHETQNKIRLVHDGPAGGLFYDLFFFLSPCVITSRKTCPDLRTAVNKNTIWKHSITVVVFFLPEVTMAVSDGHRYLKWGCSHHIISNGPFRRHGSPAVSMGLPFWIWMHALYSVVFPPVGFGCTYWFMWSSYNEKLTVKYVRFVRMNLILQLVQWYMAGYHTDGVFNTY